MLVGTAGVMTAYPSNGLVTFRNPSLGINRSGCLKEHTVRSFVALNISPCPTPVTLPLSFIPRKESSMILTTSKRLWSLLKRMVKSFESIVRNAWSPLAAIVSICISRKRSNPSRGRSSNDLLSALVRGYPVVTEPLQLVGFKQGSGKILFAFQITLASGLEDGYAGGKTVGRETS